MKTTLDFVDHVCQYLVASDLKNTISGVICKKRPINSKKEDVVINSLSAINLQLQEAILNVNIHVPNKIQRINDIQDSSQPDYKRLKQLATMAIGLLKEQDFPDDDYYLEVQQQNLLEDEIGESHYINIRIEFFHINI